MADAGDSKSPAPRGVWVRLPPPAPVWPSLALGIGVVDEFDAFLLQQDADRPEVGQ